MRVDGTYTFAGTHERLLSALQDAELLARVLPGCERLLQLGPLGDDGSGAFDVRVRTGGAVVTATVTTAVSHLPARVRLGLRGYGPPGGSFEGGGTLDLVEREGHTVLAFALDITAPALAPERHAAVAAAARNFILLCCERLTIEQYAAPGAEVLADGQGGEGTGIVAVATPRGRIIALRRAAREPALAFGASAWTERALWLGTGLVLGGWLVRLALGALRRLEDRDE